MRETATIFVGGLVTIGIITALFMPGRKTVEGGKVFFEGTQGLLRTSITGK